MDNESYEEGAEGALGVRVMVKTPRLPSWGVLSLEVYIRRTNLVDRILVKLSTEL